MNKKYLWDFGDSTFSALANPTHTFKDPNPVQVCLYLNDTITKCKDTFCQLVYNCDSRVTFKVTGNIVQILNEATFKGGYDTWSWQDGFDNTGHAPIEHYYWKPGRYTFCHTKFCRSTEKTTTCYDADVRCKANFDYKADPNDSLSIVFTNKSGGTSTGSYLWTFGENLNDFKTDTNTSYKYSKAGYYNVGLKLEEDKNSSCRDSIGQVIIVGNPPCDTTVYVYTISNNEVAFGSKYKQKDLKFDFGDGKFDYAQSGRHTYRNGGTYLVKISYVCYSKDTIRLYRKINIPAQDSCLKLSLNIRVTPINCIDTVSTGWVYAQHGLAPYNYSWNTVPPINSQSAKIPKAGVYEVMVSDANQCSRSKKIIVYGSRDDKIIDVHTNMVASVLRPGVKGSFTIEAVNEGCVTANGKLFLVLDKLLNYQNASPSPDKITGDTLFWNYSDLKIFKVLVIFTPKTNATIKDTAKIIIGASKHALETNIDNNIKKYSINIRNSYDPNIKSVYPLGECVERFVDKSKPLIYTVQFQNTGNASAINILIDDDISDEKFDLNTLKIISQSHPNLLLEVINGNKVVFRYDNIYLPDSFYDEKGSHGFIMYEIVPKPSLLNNTKVDGNAKIYFDFNPPISTNSVTNTLIDKVPECTNNVSVKRELKKNAIKLYPNPSDEILNLEIDKQAQGSSEISIVNLFGASVFKETTEDHKISLHIAYLPAGIYLIKVKSEGEILWGKFVKQ